MPASCPNEFSEDVVAVARRGDMSVKQVAKDLEITESCLRNWLARDDIEAANRPGVTKAEYEDLKKTRRRIRELETENEVLKRAAAYSSQANPTSGQSPQWRSPS